MSIADKITSHLNELNIEPKDILSFAKEDLGLNLFPAQIFIFKLFYAIPLSDDLEENAIPIGDRFNENILHVFTEVQFLEYLYRTKRININKIEEDDFFTEVVFVIGRRGTKTTMSSVITLYTIYKILLLPNPHEYFGILEEDEIGVAIVSNNRDGASRQFRAITKLVYKSPFFKKHLVKDPTGGYLFLKSNRLLDTKDEALKELMKNRGDILITTFAANPNVRGASNIVTISDEFGHFLDADVSNKKNPLDKLIFEALTPSTSGFVETDGVPAGKNFFISSPNGEKGELYNMYKTSMDRRGEKTNSLVINVPSWWVNMKIPSAILKQFFNKSERSYEQEYEAKFIKGAGSWLSNIESRVWSCVNKNNPNVMKTPNPINSYYLGIDFGVSHDGTAQVVGHYEPRRPADFEYLDSKYILDNDDKIKDVVVIDYIDYKLPDPTKDDGLVNIDDVMKTMNYIVKFYDIVEGTYDQYAGGVFAQLIKKEGHNNINKQPATQILNSDMAKLFRQLICEGRLILPDKPDFIDELFRLDETVSREGLIKVEDTDFHDDQFDGATRAVWNVYNSKNFDSLSRRAKAVAQAKRGSDKRSESGVISRYNASRGRPKSNSTNIRKPGQIRSR